MGVFYQAWGLEYRVGTFTIRKRLIVDYLCHLVGRTGNRPAARAFHGVELMSDDRRTWQTPPPPVARPVGPHPIKTYCPHCHAESEVQPQHAGCTVSCPSCSGRFTVPIPQALAPSSPFAGGHQAQLNPSIKVCVLISGIFNILVGLLWTSTLCGAVIGVPQIILAVFELVYVGRADKMPFHDAIRQGKLLGIFEIVSGLFNLISLICGILVLVFASNRR